jgi:AAA+ ATPase superfamily predicted ATPase
LTKLERKQDFSGAIWNVPIPPNPFFTGREEEIDKLKTALESTGSVALSGLGGMGKSQCAAHYAYSHRYGYRAVLWAAAESEESLKTELAKISKVLGLSESEAREQEIAVNAAMRWLEGNDEWLLDPGQCRESNSGLSI